MMDDELNIDPRETDYFDDYDMEKMMNFFELQKQLADLGFDAPALVNSLRSSIIAPERAIFTINCRESEGGDNELRTWFEYEQHPAGEYQLRHFETLFSIGQEDINRLFEPDITRAEALAVLYKDKSQGHDLWEIQRPMSRTALKAYLAKPTNNNSLNQNTMNTQNLSYLQKNLLNLGFGEKLNEELEKNIKDKKPDFILNTTQEYNQDKVDYALHFKRGDENEMYFFNKYDASLPDKDMKQTFFLNKGYGMTAKEAYNLMDGRAVHKQLTNLENEQYNAWVVIDKENKNDYGNHKLKTFSDGWNFKPERAIDKMDIVGVNEPGERDKLMKSLEKGNRHQVTVIQDGKEVKISLEANPAVHRVDIYNAKGTQQKLEDYTKPELKKETSQKQNQQSKEELPEKKARKQGAKQHL